MAKSTFDSYLITHEYLQRFVRNPILGCAILGEVDIIKLVHSYVNSDRRICLMAI